MSDPVLPSLEEVAEADDKLGSAVAAIDDFATRVKRLIGDVLPVADYAFMSKAGITFADPEPAPLDAVTFARLLVFADEAVTDAENLREYAEALREALLTLYRSEVIERAGQAAR
jgi:hypothetical protein